MPQKQSIPVQYQSDGRLLLVERIPINTPLSLQIETASACNFKCKFCIHGNDKLLIEKHYHSGIMTFELFEKIVSDLGQFEEKIKYITLHSRGEPLLNPRLPEMIKLLKKTGVVDKISLNTNGALLTSDLTHKLVDGGLDFIRFSIEGITSKAYKDICGVTVDFDDLVKRIRYYYENKGMCHVHIKTLDYNLSEEDKNTFYRIFESICDDINIEYITDTWKDAELNNEKIADIGRFKDENMVDGKVCPRLFFATQIHFDGSVVTCDSDWNERYSFGNVTKESLTEIWNGKKYNEFRVKHLKKEGNLFPMCDGCGNLHMNYKDFLDERAADFISSFGG